MKLSKHNRIAIQIVFTFSTGILSTYVPELFRDFFGDWMCQGNFNWKNTTECNYLNTSIHDPQWHWGWRHWLWAMMGLCIFVLQFFNVIRIIDEKEK